MKSIKCNTRIKTKPKREITWSDNIKDRLQSHLRMHEPSCVLFPGKACLSSELIFSCFQDQAVI